MADMRIGGLASGMDTDQIIKDLMKAERIPLDKLGQKKQYLEWQRDDYRDMNKMMFDFSNLIFDGVMKKGTYTQKTISVSDPSIVAVKNINSTTDFSGTLEVGNLAKSATTISGVTGITDSSKTIKDLMGLTGTQKINIKSVLKDGTLDPKGTSIEFDPEKETLNSLISKINQQSGVSVFFDELSQKFSFTAKNSGDATGNDIVLSDETGTFFDSLQLTDSNFSGVRQEGVNATFTYNGLTTTRPSNTFTINGFELTLKNESTGPVTFTSSPDTDKILEKLVKFVDEYNKLIEKVNGEVNEKKYRDFQPLTAEQKESMEEKEIELWEEKSRSGTLRNDSVLTSGLNKMRTDLYSPISGGTTGVGQLAQIGIETSSNYLDRGKLIIDENKLKEAISKDPNAIYEIFAKDGATSNEQGIARRLRDTLKDTMDSIEQKAGKASSTNNTFTLGRLLNNMDSQMDRFEDRLIQVEDRYWRQFTAMEKAIQRSNEQSMFLMNQFGG
ncbi:flagellar hook-associated protein 2 [Rossellomorea vietnamensis]|uniref:flagellar hook-associated protein 2 n=1 Tax=Rossellomorea vietnamensis TaxID=218284 RepID=UPI001E3B0CE0|nr:flagellar hook-associated protein 2 [Rossellomorea vietnamensis]MCC5802145.1 flagellar hook-associated protein 2 [Rossellomorea vietnamensis]